MKCRGPICFSAEADVICWTSSPFVGDGLAELPYCSVCALQTRAKHDKEFYEKPLFFFKEQATAYVVARMLLL